MNLVTKAILDKNGSVKVLDLVKKCRNLVCTFKHSNYLSDQLKKIMKINREAAREMTDSDLNDASLPSVRTY